MKQSCVSCKASILGQKFPSGQTNNPYPIDLKVP